MVLFVVVTFRCFVDELRIVWNGTGLQPPLRWAVDLADGAMVPSPSNIYGMFICRICM